MLQPGRCLVLRLLQYCCCVSGGTYHHSISKTLFNTAPPSVTAGWPDLGVEVLKHRRGKYTGVRGKLQKRPPCQHDTTNCLIYIHQDMSCTYMYQIGKFARHPLMAWSAGIWITQQQGKTHALNLFIHTCRCACSCMQGVVEAPSRLVSNLPAVLHLSCHVTCRPFGC